MALGMSDAVLDQLAALVGVVGEHLAGPADEPGGGLVAGAGHDVDVGEHLVAASGAGWCRSRPRTRRCSSSVMRSSDGCSARQSMYSAKTSPVGERAPRETSIGLPASVRRLASTRSRTASWSSSGMPSSMPITRIGIWAPRSAMKSKPPGADERVEAAGAELADLAARARSSCWGVNTRDSRPRWMVWIGGSSKMSTPGGISMSALISSRMPPRPEMNVSRSSSAPLDVVEAADARRSRAPRCSRAAPPPAAGGTPGTGRR